ncbi:MAG TPA: hypothetical protein PK364_15295 [Synergistaceae bacterium]|nr:hypothetical protein [Synergistaceae bacterium]HPJ27120.1 hypothetical protein [Synergistaceae bacterium]
MKKKEAKTEKELEKKGGIEKEKHPGELYDADLENLSGGEGMNTGEIVTP